MTSETLRSVSDRVAEQMGAACETAWDGAAWLLRRRHRARRAARRALDETLATLRRAEDVLARACAEMEEYLAAADVPRERQGRLERLLREAFFLDAPRAGLIVASGRFRRIRYLCTDVVVALAGILVSAAGFGLVVQEPLLYGRFVLALYALAFVPFVALGVSSLRALSHELSERRAAPRPPRRTRSAAKKRLRALNARHRAA